MIEAEVVLQLPIVLFDRPAAAREAHQLEERRRGRQIQQIGFALAARRERTLGEEPALGAARRGPHAHGRKAGGQRALRPLGPRDPAPRAARQLFDHAADRVPAPGAR